MAAPTVGCRVRIIKDFATVRYVGPVEKQEGTWVGVEWDDPSRGKHDGSTAGVRYFECSSGGNAASFVRIERVHFGVGVLEALLARYTNQTAEFGEQVADDQLYVHTTRQRRVKVQLVGEEKIQQQQRQVHLLESARLVGLDISSVGDPAKLSQSLPALTELDLTSNLVASWDFVVQLCTALPNLAILNLSDNRLQLPGSCPSPAALPGLRALVLNDCHVTWQQALRVVPSLPSLEELHLCGNAIGSLQPEQAQSLQGQGQGQEQVQAQQGQQAGAGDSDESGEAAAEHLAQLLPNLQVLSLEESSLCGWATVLLLRRLPRLAKLYLSGNPLITAVTYPAPAPAAAQPAAPTPGAQGPGAAQSPEQQQQQGQRQGAPDGAAGAAGAGAAGAGAAAEEAGAGTEAAAPFACLQGLYLGSCGISDWASVNELDRFPALRELRLSGNPLLVTSSSGGRFEIIARVCRLAHLNGADVRPRERRDSELRYLGHVAGEMEAAARAGGEEAKAEVRRRHPRLRALMELHGAVLATAARGGDGGGSLASRMVELKLTCVAAAAHAKMGTQVKKLPRSTTIAALRLLCERLFKVPADRMALFLRAPGEPLPEAVGGQGQDDSDRPLSFFGVQDGSEVLVDEVDPEEQRRTDEDSRAAAAAAHEARLAEQLRAAERMQAEFAKSMGLQQQQQQGQ